MRPEEQAAVFGARSHYLPIKIAERDTEEGSRLGGRAPRVVAAEPVRCPRCQGDMEYDLTLDAADLGADLGADLAAGLAATLDVSHFHCRDFACLLAGGVATTRLRTPPSIVALGHPRSPRSDLATRNDSQIPGRALLVGERVAEGAEPAEGSKIGGVPGLLQPGEGLEDWLAADGLDFVFQFSELDYPPDLTIGTYRYAAGSLYVFASFGPDGSIVPSIDGARFASFWQRT